MYVPRHFAETSLPVLHDAIESIGFATLTTVGEGRLEATHLPLLLDRERGPQGTLVGHVAKANPQWRPSDRPDVGVFPALVTFVGPEGYVSPSAYPSKADDPRVVPTWNYVAVHVTGPLRTFDDHDRLLDVVTRLTRRHEAGRDPRWEVSDAPADWVAGMLRAIVGVEIPIEVIEGKWKLSQNRSEVDRAGVAADLAGTPLGAVMAADGAEGAGAGTIAR